MANEKKPAPVNLEKVKLQWTGDGVYRGADEHLQISLTCDPGDVVEVCKTKAAELCEDPAWKPFKSRSSAASSGVPGDGGEAASTAGGGGGAMSTADASGKSADADKPGSASKGAAKGKDK